jgi:cytochrome c peroxidase
MDTHSPKQKSDELVDLPEEEKNPLGEQFSELPFVIPSIPKVSVDNSVASRVQIPNNFFGPEALARLRSFMASSFAGPEVFRSDLAKAKLGMKLFYDPRLSENKKISCSSCHEPKFDFSDQKSLAEGVSVGTMNSMSNVNAKFKQRFFWDGRANSLEEQAKGPIENALEHGSSRTRVAYTIYNHYKEEYEALFGPLGNQLAQLIEDSSLRHAVAPISRFGRFTRNPNPQLNSWNNNYLNLDTATRVQLDRVFNNFASSLAEYERGLVATNSPYDRFVESFLATGNMEQSFNEGFSYAQAYGLEKFIEAGCTTCHSGKMFSDNQAHFLALNPTRSSPRAIRAHTASLRNLEKTGPYMHDGRFANLFEVIDHYNRNNASLPVRAIAPNETAAVVAFLKSLTAQTRDLTAEKLKELQKISDAKVAQ